MRRSFKNYIYYAKEFFKGNLFPYLIDFFLLLGAIYLAILGLAKYSLISQDIQQTLEILLIATFFGIGVLYLIFMFINDFKNSAKAILHAIIYFLVIFIGYIMLR